MLNKIILGTAGLVKDYSSTNLTVDSFLSIWVDSVKHNIKYIDTAFAYDKNNTLLDKLPIQMSNVNTKIELSGEQNYEEQLTNFFDLYGYPLNILYVHDFTLENFKYFVKNLDYLTFLRECGYIKKLGVSIYTIEELDLLMRKPDFYISEIDVIQIPYNIFDRRFEPHLDKIKSLGKEVHVRSIFLRGSLFNSTLSPSKVKNKIDDFNEKLNNQKLSLINHSIKFISSNKNIDYIILGINSHEEWSDLINSFTTNTVDLNYDDFIVNDPIINIKKW
tara:strand:- start:3717 stop:4544 length:828 start_codon:yes stop_codon:yes gene_type:complete